VELELAQELAPGGRECVEEAVEMTVGGKSEAGGAAGGVRGAVGGDQTEGGRIIESWTGRWSRIRSGATTGKRGRRPE
jgi:hypothetical protein